MLVEFDCVFSIFMDVDGFWWILVLYHGLCTTMAYVLPLSMYYHGLCTTMVYVLSWSYYHGLCITMAYVLPWCSLRVTLGSLWLSLGWSWARLGSLWLALGCPWAPLAVLGVPLGRLGLL